MSASKIQPPSKIPPLAQRVIHLGGEGSDAWLIHDAALAARARGEDIILLSVGDPDSDTPSAIVEAAVAALRAGDTHYSDVEGKPVLREAVARRHQQRTGVKTASDQVIITAGAQNALFSMAQLLCDPGDEVIVPQPMYVTYPASIQASGARLVPSPARPGTMRIDLDALEARITNKTRAIFFATPSNPCGTVMTAAELSGLANLAERHNLWLVADEVYADLTFEKPHISIASLHDIAHRVITIGSLSKSHAMTGWRIGWAVGPATLMAHAANLSLCMHYGLPGFLQTAAITAMEIEATVVAQQNARYRERRGFLISALAGIPKIQPSRPEAGMFIMLDISQTGLSAGEFSWGLLRQEGVAVLAGSAFGAETAQAVRISLTEPVAILGEAAARIRRFCASLVA